MKTASVRQLRNQFPSVLRSIQNGETVAITLRRKVVATLAPPIEAVRRRPAWSEADGRWKKLFSQPRLATSGAEIITEDRDRY